MSRIKELKQNPDNNINMVDVFQIFCPEGKSKYIEFLIRLSKNTKHLDMYVNEVRENLKREFGITDDHFKGMTPFQIFSSYRFLEQSFNFSDLKTFQKFCDYNERGLIRDNDLSNFKTFDDVMTATSLAEIKAFEKDLEKQIHTLFTSDEWIVLRPLTFHASKKYGSSTKWCTSSENNPDYFLRYSKRGILIYVINKLTGLKVGCFKSLDSDPEFSFWNQIDSRIDSLESGLPDFILGVIKNEVSENPVTNNSLLTEEDRIKEDVLLKEFNKMAELSEPTDMESPMGEADMDMRNVDIREEREWVVERNVEAVVEERAYETSAMMSEGPREILRGTCDNESATLRRI